MNKLIMIVDDDDDFCYLLKRILKKINSQIDFIRCQNGQEALNYFKPSLQGATGLINKIPDLALIDINMPIMNGFEFLTQLNELAKNISLKMPPPEFMILTSSTLSKDKVQASKFAQVTHYLHKPAHINDVPQALKTALGAV